MRSSRILCRLLPILLLSGGILTSSSAQWIRDIPSRSSQFRGGTSLLIAIPEESAGDSSALAPVREPKSGNLAMLLSAALPGAGQVYAHRYYTIPLIWGFGAYFASQWIKANDYYHDYQGRFAESVRKDSLSRQGDVRLRDIRDNYHDLRDDFVLYTALTYLLNILDAYVAATLYDFDVSDDLGGTARISFRIPVR